MGENPVMGNLVSGRKLPNFGCVLKMEQQPFHNILVQETIPVLRYQTDEWGGG
jgi:hypothetical protein